MIAKDMIIEAEHKLADVYKKIDDIEYANSFRVLNAFRECNVTEDAFNATTGYGYNDIGRDVIEKVYSKIFESEASLVRSQFISGTQVFSLSLPL